MFKKKNISDGRTRQSKSKMLLCFKKKIVKRMKLNITNIFDIDSKDCKFYTKLRWIAITEDDGDIELNCNMNLTITRARPKREYDNKLNNIHKFILNHDISSIFYFDITIRTILSVR